MLAISVLTNVYLSSAVLSTQAQKGSLHIVHDRDLVKPSLILTT